jgi:hypothetical protein
MWYSFMASSLASNHIVRPAVETGEFDTVWLHLRHLAGLPAQESPMREDVVAARNPHQPEAETFHQFGHVAKRHILQRALAKR